MKFESLSNEFDHLDLDLTLSDRETLGWFIEKLENYPKILGELKYRLTDGEDPIDVVTDICNDTLGYQTYIEQVAQQRGRLFVMSATFNRDKDENPEEYEANQVILSIAYMYDSKGIDSVLDLLDDKPIKGLLPHLKRTKEFLKYNQDIVSWGQFIKRSEIPSTINNEKIDMISHFIEDINKLKDE